MIRFNQEEVFWIKKQSSVAVPMHWHDYYEIELCLSGKGTQLINGKDPDVLERGCLTLISPQDFHQLCSKESPFTFFTICFSKQSVSEGTLKMINDFSPPFFIKLDDDHFEHILKSYMAIEAEYLKDELYREKAIRNHIGLLCLDIVRLVNEAGVAGKYINLAPSSQNEIKMYSEALNFINNNYTQKISRDDVAKLCHIHPSYLSELFKSKLGISFSEYITKLRMEHAMRAIKCTNDPISNIIFDVGYNAPSTFYQNFKKYYKMLPGDIERPSTSTNEDDF